MHVGEVKALQVVFEPVHLAFVLVQGHHSTLVALWADCNDGRRGLQLNIIAK